MMSGNRQVGRPLCAHAGAHRRRPSRPERDDLTRARDALKVRLAAAAQQVGFIVTSCRHDARGATPVNGLEPKRWYVLARYESAEVRRFIPVDTRNDSSGRQNPAFG